ncbi:hypothetical protein [Solidesulfovibrio carbinolicus]|uniref:DUF1640 domain-containing protein n=1 Tax=Solidesulfovibrio carbinolicus TaxID=296842 RepID=A0A4P6HMU1_9BACT|nr:hypothetical protein [Solidesulfovibrio carbinolicus]QAZ67310.1 hypothetical protein C3Y92_08755 [Solidesulfovibrio carbinolicus]
MLLFDQSKAIERALGEEAAKPVIEAFQAADQRVMSALLAEVATKADLERFRGEVNTRLARLENMVKVLIGLTALAVAFFSPVAEKLLALVK